MLVSGAGGPGGRIQDDIVIRVIAVDVVDILQVQRDTRNQELLALVIQAFASDSGNGLAFADTTRLHLGPLGPDHRTGRS